MDAAVVMILVWGLVLLVLYWVIRLAVRHAIEDADRRRGQSPHGVSTVPRGPAGRRPNPPAAD